MIVIIDNVGTNVTSLQLALKRLGEKSVISSNPKEIQAASHVILPGVSTAERAMSQLNQRGLIEIVCSLTQPVLGICSGMQIMFDWSEEGRVDGLGIFSQKVKKIQARDDLYVPHMGWNTLNFIKENTCPLLKKIDNESYVYFVHSFVTDVGEYTTASTEYGILFSAIVAKNNFFGTQFHPERSGNVGAKILNNFLTL